MASRFVFFSVATVASLAVAVAVGCNIDPNTHYGDHAGLSKDNLPAPPSSDGGGLDGALCNGKGPIDGGPCSVSWKNDIWPMMSSSGVWKCGDSKCHGAQANQPGNLNNEDNAYAALVGWTGTGGKPYINPCSTDPAQSAYVCNLDTTTACGTRMPYSDNVLGSGPALPADSAKLQTWVKCGAPKN